VIIPEPAIVDAQDAPAPEAENDGPPQIIVCQGPPRCDLQGDAAEANMLAGCVWCRVITIHPDGSETTTEPTYQ